MQKAMVLMQRGFANTTNVNLRVCMHPMMLTAVADARNIEYLYDELYERADGKHTVIWHSWDAPEEMYCFGPDGVRRGKLEAFTDELMDPNTW
jgi:hypothetical protein